MIYRCPVCRMLLIDPVIVRVGEGAGIVCGVWTHLVIEPESDADPS